jgi:MoxR-like ATPase
MAYFIGGFTWSGESQLDRFIAEGIWENGYRDGKYQDIFDRVNVGDFFALKSTYVEGKRSCLRIVKVGNVKEIKNLYTFKIDWLDVPEQRLTDISWYANTLEQIENKSHIERIFGAAIHLIKTNSMIEILKSKRQIILQGAPGTGKTYIAKDIAEQLIFGKISKDKKEQAKALEQSNQYKIVQFHPSYTYEDFVRGVIIETGNDQPEYTTKNKILADFALQAKENWDLYSLEKEKADEILQAKSKFDKFINYIQLEIDENGKFQLTPNVYLFEYDEKRFKYKGDKWEAHAHGLNMKYSELKKVLDSELTDRSDIKKILNIESLTRQHATYYTKMAEKYSLYIPKKIESIPVNKELQKYVLIIDEINRANLPAVLGELIYALEYREESVESMYAVDGDNKLTLPPNLYIIGTMNTADRSVGQIDYAIRRRFAFIDMLPKELDIESFDHELFEKVSRLFIENYDDYKNNQKVLLRRSKHLSEEFRPEDVWLGHSYFIMQKDGKDCRDMRLNYDIKPILKEYLKDGILKISAENIINDLK